jgi:lysozyme family protein
MADFNPILDQTFKFEGGYQAFTNDTANYCNGVLIGTNRGISAMGYNGFYGVCPTVEQMKALTPNQAKAIYKKNYWDVIKGDDIKNQSVAHIMFDAHIASGYEGLRRAKVAINKYYRKDITKVNKTAITNKEVDLINDANSAKLFTILKDGEIANRKGLAIKNPSKYGQFLKGWLSRLSKITYDGAEFAKRNTPAIIIVGALLASIAIYAIIKRNTIVKTINKAI